MLKTAICTKTMETDCGVPLFKKGESYKYRDPTEKEFEDFQCSYVFFDHNDIKYMMQYDEVTEYF